MVIFHHSIETSAMTLLPPVSIMEIDDIVLAVKPHDWPFLHTYGDTVATFWHTSVQSQPTLYDGRVLLLVKGHVENQVDSHGQEAPGRSIYHGTCFETAYSAFLAWRSAAFWRGLGISAIDADSGVKNIYAMSALRSRDGVFVLGEMAQNTANPGRVYFPAGTPEPCDVKDGTLDLTVNLWRELQEETGIRAGDVQAGARWTLVETPARQDGSAHLAFFRAIQSDLCFSSLVEKIKSHLARDAKPEFSNLHGVACLTDLEGLNVPEAVAHYLRLRFERDAN